MFGPVVACIYEIEEEYMKTKSTVQLVLVRIASNFKKMLHHHCWTFIRLLCPVLCGK